MKQYLTERAYVLGAANRKCTWCGNGVLCASCPHPPHYNQCPHCYCGKALALANKRATIAEQAPYQENGET